MSINKKEAEQTRRKKFSTAKGKCVLAVIILLLIFMIVGLDFRLVIRHYEVDSAGQLENPVRIALVTDLHSCWYGDEQSALLNALNRQAPDIVMLCGDIFDDELDDKNTELFLKGISEKYTCFYVTGNHEFWSGDSAFAEKMAIVDKYGIKRLSGDIEKIRVNGETLTVCGVDDPAVSRLDLEDTLPFSEQLDKVKELAEKEEFTVLMSHHPELFEDYIKGEFDLVLCGHAHGGQWRIPYVLNGLFAPDQGLFPKYAGGEYSDNGTVMIVSRGLARESTLVPRFYNRPELVIIDCV
ncbi:MAG: metallophosphoesterase [Ruminococcaceae bacterium]|nr:metallophosphoesterase [Oscillospiraceae bacterium]